jgi:hypothetical protein
LEEEGVGGKKREEEKNGEGGEKTRGDRSRRLEEGGIES